jgi:hypothetical protein
MVVPVVGVVVGVAVVVDGRFFFLARLGGGRPSSSLARMTVRR